MLSKKLLAGIAGAVLAAGFGVAAPVPAAAQAGPFTAPFPLDPPAPAPAADLPTAAELTGILDDLADPEVAPEVKSGLVAGGMDRHRADVFNHRLREAGRHGALPLTFDAADITPAGADAVTSNVTVTGPRLPEPITKNVTFTNQGGWLLSQDAADELVEAIVGRLPR